MLPLSSSSTLIHLAVLLALPGVVACGPKKPTGLDPTIELELATRPGRWCSETTVTYEGSVRRTSQIGCDVEMSVDLVPTRAYAIRMPAPDARSTPILRTVRAETIRRRRVTLSDPRGRSSVWSAHVADDQVGPDGVSLSEARRYDLRQHRFVAFDIADTRRDNGSAFPFRTGIEGMPWEAYKADTTYCHAFARDVHLYAASKDDVQDRTWREVDEIKPSQVLCSHTHDNVFVVDLGNLDEGRYDIQVTLDNRDPVVFRLDMDPVDNYAVVQVVVRPSEY